MTNEEMAARLEELAGPMRGFPMIDEACIRSGAAALRDVDELKAKWKREECAHCDERPGGADGTIWCEECLKWWQQQAANEALCAALRDVERLREVLAELKAEYEGAGMQDAERRTTYIRSLTRINYALSGDNTQKEALNLVVHRRTVLVLDKRINIPDGNAPCGGRSVRLVSSKEAK